MSGKLQNLRRRLLELEELHATGFVDLAQYEESRALLEHWIVAAVIQEGADGAEGAEGAGCDAPPSEPVPGEPPPAGEPEAFVIDPGLPTHDIGAGPSPGRRRWPVWLAAAALVPVAGWGIHAWTSASSADRLVASAVPLADPAPAPASAARVESIEPPPNHEPDRAAAAADTGMSQGAGAPGKAGVIAGTVMLSPDFAKRVRARDTVFVYARAVDGPPMPLAVIRRQVKDLPLKFVFDDSMAIWPDARVSAYPRVVVTARVSKSGEGKAQVGDMEGQSPVVAAGTAGLRIEIGSVVTTVQGAGEPPLPTR
jgi:hypothetical protein